MKKIDNFNIYVQDPKSKEIKTREITKSIYLLEKKDLEGLNYTSLPELVVHKRYSDKDDAWGSNLWGVSELRSGMSLGAFISTTREFAIEEAINTLNSVGEQRFWVKTKDMAVINFHDFENKPRYTVKELQEKPLKAFM